MYCLATMKLRHMAHLAIQAVQTAHLAVAVLQCQYSLSDVLPSHIFIKAPQVLQYR
jgi:hypothetical protein